METSKVSDIYFFVFANAGFISLWGVPQDKQYISNDLKIMLFGSNVPLVPHGHVNENAPRYIFSCFAAVGSAIASEGGNLKTVILMLHESSPLQYLFQIPTG